MDLNKNEIAELKSIIDAMTQSSLKKAGIPKYVSAIVYGINSDGTCNLYIPPDVKNIVTNVANKSGNVLNIGDSVELCAKNGCINNAWISIKHKTNNSGTQAGDKTYVYHQSVPASVWNITHNLDKFPSVTIVDSAGSVVMGEITYESKNKLKVTFTAEFGGSAYLN